MLYLAESTINTLLIFLFVFYASYRPIFVLSKADLIKQLHLPIA